MNYFWLTIRHKWFVFLAGLRTKAPLWRLIIHDWSKFTPMELPHYQRQFFGKANQPEKFTRAWLHHQNTNPHHWEYWIPRTGHNRGGLKGLEPLNMPEWAVREMIADWLGAGRAYDGKWPDINNWTWFREHFGSMTLHKETRIQILDIIDDLRY